MNLLTRTVVGAICGFLVGTFWPAVVMYFTIFFIAIVSAGLGMMLGIQELPYLTNGFEVVERYCTSEQVIGLFRVTATIGTVGGAIVNAFGRRTDNRPKASASAT